MQNITIEPFKVIGISVRTSNQDGKAAKDIPELWAKFMGEAIATKIPNLIDPSVLSIYTNYEGDHTLPYDTILGCKVSSLENIPEGMVGQSFSGGTYKKYEAKGDLSHGIVYTTWENIWKEDLERVFSADFEVYGQKAQDPSNAEVDIFVAIQ